MDMTPFSLITSRTGSHRSSPRRIVIHRGLDLAVDGAPVLSIDPAKRVGRVALLGGDFPGIRPSFLVREGDWVRRGDPLFVDRSDPRIRVTTPIAGRVVAIVRGERRIFRWIEIQGEEEGERSFPAVDPEEIPSLPRERVRETLLDSGLWTSLRSRPFGSVPSPDHTPAALFVTVTDTSPLAVDPRIVVAHSPDLFRAGVAVLRRLLDGPLFLCVPPGFTEDVKGVETVEFAGPHPAGLAGTHIHFLMPVDQERTVWQIPYQEVIAIGSLFTLGRIDGERTIGIGGPGLHHPRLFRLPVGSDLREILDGELRDGSYRVISGSILSGHRLEDAPFLGRFHTLVSVMPEHRDRPLLGWLKGVFGRYPIRSPRSTSLHGSPRAIVPIGIYDRVNPLRIEIVWLLRSILADDREGALELGCLELLEEDLSLLSYVCPSKIDYGFHLRRMLERIAKEGL